MRIDCAADPACSDFRIEAYDFEYPEELIARQPAEPRDSSRLLVLDRDSGDISHNYFRDLPRYLKAGDCVVLNRTKVWPARIIGRKATGGKADLLLVREIEPGLWTALSSGLRHGACIHLAENWSLEVESLNADGEYVCRFSSADVFGFMDRHGLAPLPPYILRSRKYGETHPPLPLAGEGRGEGSHGIGSPLRKDAVASVAPLAPRPAACNMPASGTLCYGTADANEKVFSANVLSIYDRDRYQTVYAREAGSIAAPTAGLHFTPELLQRLEAGGIRVAEIVLHVGRGTFKPVTAEDVREHRMLPEWYHVPPAALATIQAALREGGRIITVGTTATRTLETPFMYRHPGESRGPGADEELDSGLRRNDEISPCSPLHCEERANGEPLGKLVSGTNGLQGWTDLYIGPGHRFQAVDALITNFHLPRSSPLILAGAFAGRERLLGAYREAIRLGYRLYSYGDAMLIL